MDLDEITAEDLAILSRIYPRFTEAEVREAGKNLANYAEWIWKMLEKDYRDGRF